MKPKQRFLTGIDIGLIVGIVFFSLAGGAYAVFSGVISVPGVKPFLQADAKPSPVAKKAVVASPDPSASVAASVTASVTASPSVSPSPSGSPDPLAAAKERDAKRKEDLASVQVLLKQYNDKYKKYPLTNSGADKYEKIDTALKVLVDTGFTTALPADPSPPERNYAYISDGKIYSLTAWLEDTSDPSGVNNGETPPKYLYTVKNP